MTATADELVDRCRHLMTVRRTTVEEHEFAPIAAGGLLMGDRLIWADRVFTITDFADGPGLSMFRVVGEYGSSLIHLDLLVHEEVFVLLPRPDSDSKDC